MDTNEDWDQDYEDSYDKIEGAKQTHQKKLAKKHFDMPGFGALFDMPEMKKIPKVRNAYLRVAFFKCYFARVHIPEIDRKPKETLRLFAKLFFYHQEVRMKTREMFDRFDEKLFELPEYTVLKEELRRQVVDGYNTIRTIPIPAIDKKYYPKRNEFEDEEQYFLAAENFAKGTDYVDITFNPKRRDFPRPDDIFLQLADWDGGVAVEGYSDIKEINNRRFIRLIKKKHSISGYETISSKNRKLWDQAFAFLVLDAIEELEQEICKSGILNAYIIQPYIKDAIKHFDQTFPEAKEMDKYEKAYSISLRYKKKTKENQVLPFERRSILEALKRSEGKKN